MNDFNEIFGSMAFNDKVMRERLPKSTYKEIALCLKENRPLTRATADVVANAMKDWAIEKGATHFTHWFQPMTGVTAEKHDAFLTPVEGGGAILEFSGKELIKGEPDASSFPSGGLRATFEARGYTAWDPSSYAFVKDETLYIPTAFCSYNGEALDKKTPLLRSMEALDKEARRVLSAFGTETEKVTATVGPEQEYFLVDEKLHDLRPDLQFCGRTLFGAKPPKGQELEDHYFGTIKPRVKEFMRDLDRELWSLGIYAKTEHNEVAPAQHELAPIFSSVNVASDHNQLTMEIMKKVARRHGLVCLLHEKPFAGINGSGKHNNWSISTAEGANLLDPGKTPGDNLQFLVFLTAVVAAVDEYQELLRISVASAGNDHRLGANEAPPAILSVYLGDELTSVLDAIESDSEYVAKGKTKLEVGVHYLPSFNKDTTDRNRTSPFAFTGNKFEFRMLGSANSISGANVVLNTIVAEELSKVADALDKAKDKQAAARKLVRESIKAHKRIVFNGNNYSDAWVQEAKKRGLLNLRTTVDALPYFVSKKSVDLFTRHNVFTETEIRSRYEILMENYSKVIHIEALTMLEMAKKSIVPPSLKYQKAVADAILAKRAVDESLVAEEDNALLQNLSSLTAMVVKRVEALETALQKVPQGDVTKEAEFYRDEVLAAMNGLRSVADRLEMIVGDEYWELPSYSELLFRV